MRQPILGPSLAPETHLGAQQFNYSGVSPADYYDWRAKTHDFEDMAAWRWWQFDLTGERGELPELLEARRDLEPVPAAKSACRNRPHVLLRTKIVRTEDVASEASIS
jgi:hypothetical protein